MFKIRNEHWGALTESGTRGFENHVIASFRQHAPERARSSDEKKLRQEIREASQEAAKLSLGDAADRAKYAELVLIFGKELGNDPKFPWIRAILEDKNFTEQSLRIRTLYDIAREKIKAGVLSHV